MGISWVGTSLLAGRGSNNYASSTGVLINTTDKCLSGAAFHITAPFLGALPINCKYAYGISTTNSTAAGLNCCVPLLTTVVQPPSDDIPSHRVPMSVCPWLCMHATPWSCVRCWQHNSEDGDVNLVRAMLWRWYRDW